MKTLLFIVLILLSFSCEDDSYITIPVSVVFERTWESDLVRATITNELETKIRTDTLSASEKRDLHYIWDQKDNKGVWVTKGIYFISIYSDGKKSIIGKGMVVVE